jgi:hypothetical protein
MKNNCMGIFKFEKNYFELFDSVIYPLISTLTGLSCNDARSYYESKSIKMDLIARMIEESNLIIIEITENNPNIFLEFGIAYQLKKPLILLCKEEIFKSAWKENLPFDIRGRELLLYTDETDLRVKLGKYVFDALYKTTSAVVSWKSNHPHNHISSNSQINFFHQGEVWSDRAINNSFTIRYRIEISEVKVAGKTPDIRLFFAPQPYSKSDQSGGYPRILVILPWERSEKTKSEYECHIDYMKSTRSVDRLQQVAVGKPRNEIITKSNPLIYDCFVSFTWPNLIVESSLFKKGKERLVVPLERFRDEGYPLHLPQYIGFDSMNSDAIVNIIEIKEIFP